MANYFEGWYFKHQKGENTLALIPGRSKDGAFLQVVTAGKSYCLYYDIDDYYRHKIVRLGSNRFALNGIKLDIHRPEITLTGALGYSELTPLESDIMGPFAFLPMQCHHAVLSMQHRITGTVELNGQLLNFTGGTGYIEADHGCSFPKSYTWLQCGSVEDQCSVMVSIAQIPIAGLWFWGCICAVYYKGQEYRLATYKGVKIICRNKNHIELIQGNMRLVADIPDTNSHDLSAPYNGRMARVVRENPATKAEIKFYIGQHPLFDWVSDKASFEFVE